MLTAMAKSSLRFAQTLGVLLITPNIIVSIAFLKNNLDNYKGSH